MLSNCDLSKDRINDKKTYRADTVVVNVMQPRTTASGVEPVMSSHWTGAAPPMRPPKQTKSVKGRNNTSER